MGGVLSHETGVMGRQHPAFRRGSYSVGINPDAVSGVPANSALSGSSPSLNLGDGVSIGINEPVISLRNKFAIGAGLLVGFLAYEITEDVTLTAGAAGVGYLGIHTLGGIYDGVGYLAGKIIDNLFTAKGAFALCAGLGLGAYGTFESKNLEETIYMFGAGFGGAYIVGVGLELTKNAIVATSEFVSNCFDTIGELISDSIDTAIEIGAMMLKVLAIGVGLSVLGGVGYGAYRVYNYFSPEDTQVSPLESFEQLLPSENLYNQTGLVMAPN